jgi:hypothetical protein
VHESEEERHESASAIVRPETIEAVSLKCGYMRLTCPPAYGFHGVEMGIEEHGGASWQKRFAHTPHIIHLTLGVKSLFAKIVFKCIRLL